MLELRPTCENCNKALPADSIEARICTCECTFCAACVDNVLENVCPNCGGGFVPAAIYKKSPATSILKPAVTPLGFYKLSSRSFGRISNGVAQYFELHLPSTLGRSRALTTFFARKEMTL
jgi:hypothetical protein